MKSKRIAFWVLLAVTVGLYLVMLNITLPAISDQAGGLEAFDLRPIGYSYADAQAFLTALTPQGADFYLSVQHLLDSIYPALLAITLFFAIVMISPKRLGGWRWIIALIAIPGSIFDYLENAAVSGMIAVGPGGITEAEVARASLWTLLKSGFTTVALVVLLIMLATWVFGRGSKVDPKKGVRTA